MREILDEGCKVFVYRPSTGWQEGWRVTYAINNGECYMCHNPDEHFQNRVVKARHIMAATMLNSPFGFPVNAPTVVCLCGSTRFSDAFREANLQLTLAGCIVLTIGCDMRSDAEIFAGKTQEELSAIKAQLDDLHLHKIAMSNEVLILNVGGYIGESTRRELLYAYENRKDIRFLEPVSQSKLSELINR